MSLFKRAVYITCIIKKLIITHQEPIEGIKVWILLGYPRNILDIQVNTVITLPRGNYDSFPTPPPQWITFLIFIPQKILLNIKDVEFDFRLGCILVLFPFFMNNKCAIYKNFIFCFSKLAKSAYFDDK